MLQLKLIITLFRGCLMEQINMKVNYSCSLITHGDLYALRTLIQSLEIVSANLWASKLL